MLVRLRGTLAGYRTIRSLCDGKGFKSILSDSKVVSPFADPRKTRKPLLERELSSTVTSHAKIEIPKDELITPLGTKIQEPLVVSEVPKEKEQNDIDALKASLEKLEQLSEESKKSGSSGDGGSGSQEDFDHQAEAEKRRKRMERNTKITGAVFLGGSVIGFITFCFYYGRAKRDEEGNLISDEYSGQLLAPFYRIYDSVWQWRDFVVEPAREKLLPDPLAPPYLQPKYTLVIEMKNILVAPEWTYKTGYRFAKRPALDYFLDVVGYPNYEVVIYTSESAMTAVPVIDSIDPKQRIMFRLYRDCTKYANGHHMKDLSKLNRDLSKVIFLEFDAKSGQLNVDNMLRVPEWKGNMDDTSLVDLAELLKTIYLSDVDDVRPTIQYYSQFDDPAKEFRRRAIYLAEQEEQKKAQPEESSLLKKYSGGLFGFRRR
ncbi:unnamed protein product [Auanema sp. JU1783]|nr:unnamed protein product [Auanema sp. JU1783]